jgi:hypothetical protein
MTTPNSSADIISLPRLTVAELLSLMLQLQTEFFALQKRLSSDQTQLPAALIKSAAKMEEASTALQTAYQTAPIEVSDKKGADRVMDAAWRAVEAFLRGLTLLQAHHSPGPREATVLYGLWFYDGLKFINYVPEVEYQETKKRLELLREKNLTDSLKALGGAPFLSDLESAFLNYGQALHITNPRSAPAPSLRPVWEKAQELIRLYVTKVVGLEDPDEPETLSYIKALLAPLKEWEQKSAPETKKPEAAAPTPTETPKIP